MQLSAKLKLAKTIMFIAAIYSVFLGMLVFVYPQILLFGNPSTPFLLIVLKFLATLVGVYGIAYYFASRDPERYWHLILVGFIGKVLAAIIFFYYTQSGELHPQFIWVNVWNNLLWLLPMGWVIYICRAKNKHTVEMTEDEMAI